MAAGEYVSVSSQADIEAAELSLEKIHLEQNWDLEIIELATIYQERGLDKTLSIQVAKQLMKSDALSNHARDELGITDFSKSKPFQAAWLSALSFSAGAGLPLFAILVFEANILIAAVVTTSLLALVILGCVSAWLGGTPKITAALRILLWGSIAMAASIAIGHWFHVPG